MALETIPESIRADMITRLFGASTLIRYDSLLVPGYNPQLGLLDSVTRESPGRGYPEITLVASDEVSIEQSGEDIGTLSFERDDFLDEEFSQPEPFDYILCHPPQMDWNRLPAEKREAYAANSSQITPTDSSVSSEVLYFEQALRWLANAGRAVFLTSPEFKIREHDADFRAMLFYHVEDIIEYTPEEYPSLDQRYIATVLSKEADEETALAFRYDPTESEAMLAQEISTDRPFTARALMTPDPDLYDPTTPIAEAYLDLVYNDYDAAPVDSPNENAPPEGYISRAAIRTQDGGTAQDHLQSFSSEVLIDPDTGIREVIQRLTETRFIFVGSESDIRGIITRFDLNRLPVYLYLFDCFSEFEIGLRRLIRTTVPDWDTIQTVSIATRPEESVFSDRIACGKLGDLIDIVTEAGVEKEIRSDINGADITLNDIKNLRNHVAHYNPIIHTMSDSSTAEDVARGARQLDKELAFLHDCNAGLN
ncbi:CBS domain-containing protein [Halorubellus salinus]|uniref:CBS domain-containing protein n=1 Tax=Halorubellus salinus TaxID=755309 RepID=UPI001D083DB5|nr:CBS domain-containing protein [Halorubellus salinus]